MPSDACSVESLVQLDSLSDSQIEQLRDLLEQEWGLKGRTLDDLRLMIRNTSVIVAFAEKSSGRLVACCRVLTDFVFQATIHGVIVAEDWRGHGLGQRLMDAAIEHPRLQRVRSLWLRCFSEMEGFYKKWDFEVPTDDGVWMRRQSEDRSGWR